MEHEKGTSIAPMKIAMLSTFYPYRGGIAQFNASLYRAFEAQGHHVRAFNFSRQYPSILFPGKTQRVSPSDAADAVPSEAVLDSINPLTYFRAANAVKKFAPDLLLMRYWIPFFAPALGTVARLVRKQCTVVSILDNVLPHEKRPGDTTLTRFFLRPHDGFVALSSEVQKDLQRALPGASCLVYPHPLYDHFGAAADAAEARKKLGVPPAKRVLLFFGFIRDYKGLDVLIRALSLLDERYILLIGGEVYGDFAPYEKLIRELHLDHRVVRHVRYIDDAEVPGFFAAADVCVLPYKSATQSGIASIAFHFDKPMIATRVGGLTETIVHGHTGLVADSPDPALVATQVRRYYDENLEGTLVANIKAYKKEASWPGLADAIARYAQTLHRS